MRANAISAQSLLNAAEARASKSAIPTTPSPRIPAPPPLRPTVTLHASHASQRNEEVPRVGGGGHVGHHAETLDDMTLKLHDDQVREEGWVGEGCEGPVARGRHKG